MSSFYYRYRNLFLDSNQNKQPSLSKSLVKQYLYDRPKRNPEIQFNYSLLPKLKDNKKYDRFQTEVIPEIKRLNNKSVIYPKRFSTEAQVDQQLPLFYSPQIKSKKINVQIAPNKKNQPKDNIFFPYQRNVKHLKADQSEKKKTKNLSQIQKQKQIQIDQIKLPYPHFEKSEPQKGLIFSEYTKMNDYEFVNIRLSDIRKANKFHPRGYINQYREALLQRKKAKQHIEERRSKLKQIFMQQEMEYSKKRPIV